MELSKFRELPSAILDDRTSSAAILKHLEKSLQRGLDLLSIFGRYDSAQTGRISVEEFCAGLSELGLSTASSREVVEMGIRLKCGTVDYIFYRRLVIEVLRDIDDKTTNKEDLDCIETTKNAILRSMSTIHRLKVSLENYDRKKNGKVHMDDLPSVFNDANIKIRRSEIESIIDRFPPDHNDNISYEIFYSELEKRMIGVPGGPGGDGSSLIKKYNKNRLPEELLLKLKEFFEDLILLGMFVW